MKVAIINDTRPNSHYGCSLVMNNLIDILDQNNVQVTWTWPVSKDWRKHKKELLRLPEVDAFIVNGEGTIHHAQNRKYAMALACFSEFAEKEIQKPSYLINATLFSNSAEAYSKISNYKKIFVRDSLSITELNQTPLEGFYAPDLTFSKKTIQNKNKQPSGVCVIDSTLKDVTAKLKIYANDNNYDFKSMVTARPGNVKFLRNPKAYVKNIIQWVKEDHKVSLSPESYINALKKYDFIVTARYHTVTMCIKNVIPFVAIKSNTPKINSLLNDVFGNSNREINLADLEHINHNDYNSFNKSETLDIKEFTKKSEDRIDAMIKEIISDISNTHKI